MTAALMTGFCVGELSLPVRSNLRQIGGYVSAPKPRGHHAK